jgi:hypothetical protein
VTPIAIGQNLSVAELTSLKFLATPDMFGQTSTFTYRVTDPRGVSANGVETLTIGAHAGPQTNAASLTVNAGSGLTPIGITAPTDGSYAASDLAIVVTALPSDGTVYLGDGRTVVGSGQSLTVAQLTTLTFAPTPGVSGQSAQFSYTVTDPAGSSAVGTATLTVNPAASGHTLTVGSGQQYATIAAAIAAAQNGDTVQVQAGTYTNDFASINKNITLHGVGGMVNLVASGNISNGKGIFVVNGNVNIDHFSFSGAKVADGNGAGIRFESGNLVLDNDYFFNNQDGLLSGSSGSITIRNSEFANNGTGDGFTHNLYVNKLSSLVIDSSYFHDAVVGHEIKSRALATTITNSRIQDQNGRASYSIDLPNGGNALIDNNTIEQGQISENPVIIAFGEEGGVYSGSSLQVTNNLVLNDLASSSPLAINNTVSNVTAQINGNRFFGLTQSQVANGANTQSGNIFLTAEPTLLVTHPWG